jgi:3-oxoacyl-[acyl-carrier-protein] synthase-3
MNHHVYVDRFSYALGSVRENLEAAATRRSLVSPASALSDAGFCQHWTCAPGETAYDLAQRAVTPIAASLGDVGAIVYATCIPLNASMPHAGDFETTRDVRCLMDFPASRLQAELGLERATVMGLDQQACTGMLGSLRLARALLLAEPDVGRVLCVTADRFPDGALYEQSYNLISDGAAACVVSAEPGGFRILAVHAVTNGALVMASDDETVGSYFSYAHRVIGETLAKCQLDASDIDYVVPQNTNGKAWQILARLLGIDPARVYMPSIAEVGHVISSDSLINLAHLMATGQVRAGQRVLLFMAGYGLNWQCVVLEAC